MKKLLIIGYVWPEPRSSAAGSRMMELIELFHISHWRIVFASAAAPSGHRADLSAFGVQEQTIILNDSSFNDFVGTLKPDAVLFDRFFTEEQFGWRIELVCPQALRILDTEDLHSLRYVRQQSLKQRQKQAANEAERRGMGPVLMKEHELYQSMVDDDMAQREIAAIYRSDLSLIISQFEMTLLTDYFMVPNTLLHYCPFLKLKMQLPDAMPGFSERRHFISIGNFRHEPNWDAVQYLKHAIWPVIRSRLPDTELHVYGAYTPPKAMQLHNPKQGFHIKGWAADAFEVISSARLCLAPLRFGAGIKGKLLDAMRTGTPSITTSIGAEAMSGNFAWGGQIENEAYAFADAAEQLYSDEAQWHKAQQRGFEILANYFSQKDYVQLLLERLRQLEDNLVQERQQNFVGTLLRHQFHKSTEYMSRWIEAKNNKGCKIF